MDITGKDLSTNIVNISRNDIDDDSGKIIFFTEQTLSSKTHNASNSRIAIKKTALTDLDFNGNIDINLLENSNGYKGNSSNYILFETLGIGDGHFEYSRIAIKRSSLLNPNFTGNVTIDLLDEEKIDKNYFLVNSNSANLTGDSLVFSQNDIMKNESEILYFKQNTLENYFSDTGDLSYIAVKRRSLIDLNFENNTTINLSNNVGFKNNTDNYIKFPLAINTIGIKIDDLFKSSTGFKGKTNNFIKFPNITDNNGLDQNESVIEKYLYEESIDKNNIIENTIDDSGHILVKKDSLTTVDNGGIDSYEFSIDSILKLPNAIKFKKFTNSITRKKYNNR